MNRILACIVVVLMCAQAALAQNPAVHQSGNVTPNHGVKWITNGVIGDSGGSAVSLSGTAAPNQLALWLSSGLLSGYFAQPNRPLIGAPSNGTITQGTLSGTTTEFGTVSGALTTGDCLKVGTGGNIVDLGSGCNTGAVAVPTYQIFSSPGTVSSVTLTQTPLPTNASLVQVSVDGIVQARSTWSLNLTSGVLTFNNAVTYINTIEVDWWSNASVASGVGSITVGGVTYSGSVTLPTTGTNGTSLLQVYNPTQAPYNAVGDGVHDDTAAWQAMCSAISTAGSGWIVSPPNKTYLIFTSSSNINQLVACGISNVTGFRLDMDGSQIKSGFASQFIIGGTGTSGDQLQIWFTSLVSAFTAQEVTYSPTNGQSCASMATGVVAAINANATLTANSITATANGCVVNMTPPATQITWFIGQVNGSGLIVTGAGTETLTPSTPYFLLVFNSQNIEINDLVGTAISGYGDSNRGSSLNWIECSNEGGNSDFSCRNMRVHRANLNGGINGVAVTRTLGGGLWGYNIHADGIFQNLGYPFSDQADGLNSDFDITTFNVGRSYIGYNTCGVRGHIVASRPTFTAGLDDIEVGAFGHNSDISLSRTCNMDFDYTYLLSSFMPSSFLSLSHQQGDPTHANLPSTIANVRFHTSINGGGTTAPSLLFENSFVGTAGNETPGDPGNTDSNIEFTGDVVGVNTSSVAACFLAPNYGCPGFNGTSTGTFHVHDANWGGIKTAVGQGSQVTFGPNFTTLELAPTQDSGFVSSNLSFIAPLSFPSTINWSSPSCAGSSSVTVVHGAISAC